MTNPISREQALRYNRQIVLPQIDIDGQEQLLNARVLIIGMGGLGCSAAQLLASAGIGHLTLVDDDSVAVTNLPRQILFGDDDVGRLKVVAAKDRLLQLNAHCQINTTDHRLTAKALAHEVSMHDIVIDCTDNLASRMEINQACAAVKTPMVSGAAIRFEGQLFVTCYAPDSPCYACLGALINDKPLSCTEAGIFAPVVAIIGAQQALLAMQVIAGIGQPPIGSLQLFDGLSGQWQQYQVPRKSDCPICQKK
ncbi:molybdopterin-synthase adenylyltransferase MoeB [Salinimonas sp. HHU 13199]|uniref:Molybdopterin-synthase adenylyltransferase MoeB n=1 Tax=Salinimonas profundi TaxID=2729140 RepID=A0ABR8LJI6_9ALTE|nr:molybdopterin-synthase adenylyltransferase MoeB [Salinimonas profundi]MBD3584239.1 molybdopterin-synthase adenylyltransferase MoeB [Salinimonas profundi]